MRKRWSRQLFFRFAFMFLGVLIFLGEFHGAVLAWDAEAHYALTYYIALHVGYTPRQAFQIASASYAIDEDSDCEPIPKDANLEYALSVAAGQPPAPSHRRWKLFHAFSLDGMPRDQAEKEFHDDCNYLWQNGVADRNPGPYIHLTQDYYAHFFWDTKRGHMFAGHSVDYLSYIPEDSKKMAISTIAELSKFMKEVMHKKPQEVPWERLSIVIDKLGAANPTPRYLTIDNFDPKILPDLSKAVVVINRVVEEDVQNGLLPRWPNEAGWQNPKWLQSASMLKDWMKLNGVEEFQPLPGKWYQFDFNSQGQIVKNSPHADAYAVEEISLVLGKETIEIQKLDEYNVQATLRVPYKISGVKNIPVISPPPLPVLEVHQLAKRLPSGLLNRDVEPKVFLQHRGNGDFVAQWSIHLSADSLKSQNLVWECTIYLSGLPPKIVQVDLKPEGVTRQIELVYANAPQSVKVGEDFGCELKVKLKDIAQGKTVTVSAWNWWSLEGAPSEKIQNSQSVSQKEPTATFNIGGKFDYPYQNLRWNYRVEAPGYELLEGSLPIKVEQAQERKLILSSAEVTPQVGKVGEKFFLKIVYGVEGLLPEEKLTAQSKLVVTGPSTLPFPDRVEEINGSRAFLGTTEGVIEANAAFAKSGDYAWNYDIQIAGFQPLQGGVPFSVEQQQPSETSSTEAQPGDWTLKEVKLHKTHYDLYNQETYRSTSDLQQNSASLTTNSWAEGDTYSSVLSFSWGSPPSVLKPGQTFTLTFQGTASASPPEKCPYSWITYCWTGFDVKINGKKPEESCKSIEVGMTSTKEWFPSKSDTATFTVPTNVTELAIYVSRGEAQADFVYERKM